MEKSDKDIDLLVLFRRLNQLAYFTVSALNNFLIRSAC